MRPRILVVDDREENFLCVRAALGELRCAFEHASSGQEALASLTSREFALILLDVQMPGMDGFETAAKIRALPLSKSTPIIFLTAISASLDDVSRAYRLGAVDFVTKPFDVEMLKAKASVFLELFNLRKQAQEETSIANRDLKANYEKYQAFIQQSTDGMWRYELDRPIPIDLPADEQIQRMIDGAYLAECNDAMAQMYGFSQGSEMVGKRLRELLVPDDPQNRAFLAAFIASGYRLSGVDSIEQDRFGNEKHFSNSMVGITEDGLLSRAWGTQKDITDQVLSRKKLELAVQAGALGIFHWNFLTGEASWSEETYRIFGFERDRPRASIDLFLNAIHPDDRDRVSRSVRDAIDRVDEFTTEFRSVHSNGEIRWVLESGRVFLGAGDKPTHMLGTVQDITERKKIEEKASEGEARFRLVMDSIPHFVWTARPDGSANYFNQWWYEYTGRTFEETKDWRWTSLMHPEDREVAVTRLSESVKAGVAAEHQHRFKRNSDGSWRWHLVRTVPLRNELGEITTWVGTATDIHDQKMAEENSRLIIETIPQGIWRTNPDGSADYFSTRFTEIVDTDTSKFLGWGWTQPIHPDDQPRLLTEWQRCRDAGIPVDVEFRLLNRRGRYVWFRSQGRPFFNEKGEIIKYYGTWTNVDIQKKASQELLAAKEAAEKANDLKSAFLANMSHEIRTPLGAMIGFADLLRDPAINETEKANYLEILRRNGEQLGHLINDILDLSKIETGHLSLEYTPINPLQVANEVVSLLSVLAKERSIEIRVSQDPTLPKEIVTDPVRLRQVLTNIVGNALKFTKSGTIDLKLAGRVLHDGKKQALFEVTDTGIGIPEASVESLFKAFTQADNSITRKYGGTGLGLALSRSLARAMGGDLVLVKTRENHGSTFLITINSEDDRLSMSSARIAAEMKVDSMAPPKEKQLDGLKILLVEDAKDNQQLIHRYLSRQGAEVEIVENGLEGLQAALRGDYHLVLMDIQMPVMDGYTATSELRSRGYDKPIIALTAHAMSDVRQRCMDVGYTDHLPKPINSKELVQKIALYAN